MLLTVDWHIVNSWLTYFGKWRSSFIEQKERLINYVKNLKLREQMLVPAKKYSELPGTNQQVLYSAEIAVELIALRVFMPGKLTAPIKQNLDMAQKNGNRYNDSLANVWISWAEYNTFEFSF